MTILLLKNNDISINTPLGNNIDIDRYLHAIRDAQRTELKPLLGNDLYLKICEDFRDGLLTGLYDELYTEFVRDFVIHEAASLYLHIGAYQISNAGITKTSTDNSQSINKEEVDYLVYHQRNLAKNYKRQMLKFLKDNKDSIPEYNITSCNTEKGSNVFGIYIPKNDRKYRGY
jgi:hypothetical protein